MTGFDIAREWCAAWNDHDVERVLALFHDDVVFTSPVAAALSPESGGLIKGKPSLRAYWTLGLQRFPDLHFTIEAIFEGVETLVLHYRNQAGDAACEVLFFEEGKVRRGAGCYVARGRAVDAAAPQAAAS